MSTNNAALAQLATQAVTYMGISSAFTKRALEELQVRRSAQKRAADLRDGLVDYLTATKLIRPTEKDAAAAMLGSHAETMTLVRNLAERLVSVQQAKTAEAGSPAEDPTGAAQMDGSHPSLNGPFVGARTTEKKASDHVLARIMENPTGR